MATEREMKRRNPWHTPLIIGLTVLFVLGIIALVTTAIVQNKPLEQKLKYGIVLDAGSSHTSLYIYEWPAEKQNNTGVVRQLYVCDVEGPGISSYSKKLEKAGASLQNCMEKAKEIIPERRHSETPVYLGATAGMRLLRKTNTSASEDVLSSVQKVLQGYPFKFEGARIITGQEEGAYGWITVNYLSKKFERVWQLFDHPQPIGALDLGGASTQITFVPKEDVASEENSLHFRLYGTNYNVYTHSFLCYGKDQALNLALAQQLQEGNDTLYDPCFNKGYYRKHNVSAIYSSPCIWQQKTISQETFSHHGTGDAKKCQESVRKIFNFTDCSWPQCSFNGVYQPTLHGKFGAFSAFYFVMDFLNLTKSTLEEFKNQLESYCSKPWAEVKNNYKIKEKYLREYCFSGTYILTLLESGYNFTSENWKEIEFIKKIGSSDAGWTLGYMLNLTNMIPAEAPDTPPLSHACYVFMMVIFSVLLLVLLFIGLKCFGKARCRPPKEII
ncbi:ectonucleoside triphosphate diphosphohydrolase 1 isoform X2 [Amia ocellicauda]|uniref:ectonucleoside triphosphate diphosphohydrolase 1 isoform X2 n=1 Tax=Amia ocellicauda TaxID=2972642 RepID=UPI0034640BAF